ncbi:MAG: ABC transporter permease, partial [Synergistaceae bacterium]|nr:ABC transporter permease [Synergistaceae bacterium]
MSRFRHVRDARILLSQRARTHNFLNFSVCEKGREAQSEKFRAVPLFYDFLNRDEWVYSLDYFKYAIKRIVLFIPILLAASALIFFSLRLSGVSPVSVMLGERQTSPEVIAELKSQFHLDRPLIAQYGLWLADSLKGHLGVDYINRQPVTTLISDRVSITLGLVLFSIVIGATAAVLAGVASGLRNNTWVDHCISVSVLILVSMPSFLTSIVTLILIISVYPQYIFTGAIGGAGDYFSRIMVPSVVLSFNMIALVTRVTRSSMIEQLKAPYMQTAVAKGISRQKIIWGHCFKNAMIPVLTIVSIFAGTTISGAVMVESVFSLPGLGSLLINGIKTNN